MVIDILRNAPVTAGSSSEPRGYQMPGRYPCQPGCTCRKHDKAFQSRPCADDCSCGRHPRGHRTTADERRAQVRESVERHREANPGSNAAAVQRWREANPEVARQRGIENGQKYRDKYLYGLTPDSRAELLAAQNGCCYLCDEPLDLENPRKIHVDHDHSCCRGTRSCGKCIRGIACERCNKGIGLFGDDPDRMERVAARLRAANAAVIARRESAESASELPGNVRRLKRREAS